MTKEVRIATKGISAEMMNMEVGDVVRFPVDSYNYNSIRSTPSSALLHERMAGRQWKTKINYEEKGVDVTRVS